MAKFHISKDGTARQCRAQTPDSCRATKSDQKEHYETKEEAEKSYEQKNTTVKSFSKKNKNDFVTKKASLEEQLAKSEEKIRESFSEHHYHNEQQLDKIAKRNQITTVDLINNYNDSTKNYNKFLDNRYENYKNDSKVTLEELSNEVKAGEDFIYHSRKIASTSDERMELYLKNIRLYKNSLNLENKALRREIEKVEKSGRIRSAFDNDFKTEKENKLNELNNRLKNNRSSIVKAINSEESVAAGLQAKKLKILETKGYGTVQEYDGMSMSMHPKGPEFKYNCPNCGIMHTNRLKTLQYVRDVGYTDACRSCSKRMILPVTKTNE